jgi:hypothetical protein
MHLRVAEPIRESRHESARPMEIRTLLRLGAWVVTSIETDAIILPDSIVNILMNGKYHDPYHAKWVAVCSIATRGVKSAYSKGLDFVTIVLHI